MNNHFMVLQLLQAIVKILTTRYTIQATNNKSSFKTFWKFKDIDATL